MEDNRNALFVEPNAYIQRIEKKEKLPQKIVFQEPYESVPNYYMNNGFKKNEFNSVKREMPKPEKNGFDIKSLTPILGMFGGEMGGLSEIVKGLSKGGGIQNLISTIMANPDMVKKVLGMFNKSETKINKEKIKKSDFEIKNYTKVE